MMFYVCLHSNSREKNWNEPLLWNWFDPDLVEQIVTIPIPHSDISDIRVVWNPLAQCSITNAYAFIEQHFEWKPTAAVADTRCFFQYERKYNKNFSVDINVI